MPIGLSNLEGPGDLDQNQWHGEGKSEWFKSEWEERKLS